MRVPPLSRQGSGGFLLLRTTAKLVVRGSRGISVKNTPNGKTTTGLFPLLFLGIFLALSFLGFPVKDAESNSQVSDRSYALQRWNSFDLSCLSECSSADFTVSNMSYSTAMVDSTFCDPQVSYKNQPAECQTAANTRRLALYVPVVGAILIAVLATALAFLLIRL